MSHNYDLTITNCAITVDNMYHATIDENTNSRVLKRLLIGDLLNGMFHDTTPLYSTAFLNSLHELQKNRLIESGQKLQSYSKQYLIDLRLFSDEELATLDNDNNTNKNVLLKKFKRSYLLDNIIVQFEDGYEIIIENNEPLYFKFLILMLCDYGVLFIEDILNHHIQKITNPVNFITKLKKHLLIIPEILKDKDILNEIDAWILNNEKKQKVKSKEYKLTNKQIALIAIYNGETVSRKNNGDSIYNLYCSLKTKGDRLAAPTNKRAYNEKIKLFESVVNSLSNNAKNTALLELTEFKKNYSDDFNT